MRPINTMSALYGASILSLIFLGGCKAGTTTSSTVPTDIRTVFNKPAYKGATWALRVVNVKTGKVLINYNADQLLYIGSVRKTFTVGELLNQVGPNHHYDTPVYKQGSVDSAGILHGDLIIQASGDLTMGGRTNPDGSVAYTEYDHNEADSLGNAILTKPDPLAGYKALAAQVAATGIKEVTGDVVIDNRLFQPFNFRGEFDVVPIFVNDDMVDVTINPATVGQPASVVWRPHSAAFSVNDNLTTGAADSTNTLQMDPEIPQCLGSPGCSASISGNLPADYVPPLTNTFPLVQAFRIANPANYARTVFIEALEADGVTVDAPTVAVNPTQILPAKNSYQPANRVAMLTGLDYAKDAKLILKVSYNIGADASLVLYGLTQGVDSMPASLQVEQTNLAKNYGIPSDEYQFYDGSGGGETKAELKAVTKLLTDMHSSPYFSIYQDALPILGVNGSIEFVTNFESDPTLAGAAGQVYAKPGTWIKAITTGGLDIKGQALGGYIHTKSGKTLAYVVDINNAQTASLDGLIQIFQDEGTISAMLWRDY